MSHHHGVNNEHTNYSILLVPGGIDRDFKSLFISGNLIDMSSVQSTGELQKPPSVSIPHGGSRKAADSSTTTSSAAPLVNSSSIVSPNNGTPTNSASVDTTTDRTDSDSSPSSRIPTTSRKLQAAHGGTQQQQQKFKDTLIRQAKKIRQRWRKIVTGNEEKRIRDYVQEAEESPSSLKMIDKVGFTLGVLNIVACQYFLLTIPEYFPLWYSIIIPITMITRFMHFKSMHWQYFMIDFCYFTIFLSIINILLPYGRNNNQLFKICFIFATGILPIAIPVWRNSFVFHDFDRITSVYIHILPCMLYYTLRWSNRAPFGTALFNTTIGNSGALGQYCLETLCTELTVMDYIYAILLYILWQIMYLVKTEILDKERFDSDPSLVTSLRWLSKDTKNPLARKILSVLRAVGIFGVNEEYDSTSMKTKLVFVGSQLLLTLVSIAPTPLSYYSQSWMLLYIGMIFTIAVYNGASYYIEVFSKRYHLHIQQLENMHEIASDAHHVANELIKLSSKSHSMKDKKNVMSNAAATVTIPAAGNVEGGKCDTAVDTVHDNKCMLGMDVLVTQTLGEKDDDNGEEDPAELIDLSNELLRTSEEVWRELKTQTKQLQEYSTKSHGDGEERVIVPELSAEQSLHLD